MDEFKKRLGPLAKDYDEEGLIKLRADMYNMAKLLIDFCLVEQGIEPPQGRDEHGRFEPRRTPQFSDEDSKKPLQ
jgi:hypothetical protein